MAIEHPQDPLHPAQPHGAGSPVPEREPLMFRVHLFEELLNLAGGQSFRGGRILEIGPRDGRDSTRLASLSPDELVMVDLPEKRGVVAAWLAGIACPNRYLEANFMYLSHEEYAALGTFDLIWCTGVLYHNAEQLRLLRRIYKMLNKGGYFVLESATLRVAESLRGGCYVEIHFPETYRNTGTITHLPSAPAINAWLSMVGFQEIHPSSCYEIENRDLLGQRYACICKKTADEEGSTYYWKTGMNPEYRFGDAT
jgi:SAM-dependent methyltransferase